MLFTIAWRNVWRNKKRSGVLLAAIALGLWAGIVTYGLMYGMADQMVQAAIENRTAHIQIHNPGFRDHVKITNVIPDGKAVLDSVRGVDHVAAAGGRIVLQAMVSSPTTTQGIEAYGIDPAVESKVSAIKREIVVGTYFESDKRNPVVIGQELAKKLDVGLGHKIVITGQDATGEISGGAFRIVGLFKTTSSQFDKLAVFARQDDLGRIFSLGNKIHEIAIIVDQREMIDSTATLLHHRLPKLDVATWEKLSPDLAIMTGANIQSLYIFLIVILIALAFGITNTMLMGVMERVRELGVIISLGMDHLRVFAMIALETIFLALMGAVLGMLFAAGTVKILAHTGINLSIVAEGLASYGASHILYPSVPLFIYPLIASFVIATALVAAIYPGVKAARLNPTRAVRMY
jgi:putative ABC transport system permease protein